MADSRERTGEQLPGPLPAGAGDELPRICAGGPRREREPDAVREIPTGGGRGGLRPAVAEAARVCGSGRRRAGRVSAAGAFAQSAAGGTAGPGRTPGLPRTGCAGAGGGCRRRIGRRGLSVGDGTGCAGRGAGRAVQGGAGRSVLQVNAGANAVLRHLFLLGAMGAAEAAAERHVQLARGRLAPARAGAAGAVPAALGSGSVAAAGPSRGVGLDSGGAEPGGAGRLLRKVQRGAGGAVLLRAVPAGLRPRRCASSWGSGTRRRRWCATWWRGWTGR